MSKEPDTTTPPGLLTVEQVAQILGALKDDDATLRKKAEYDAQAMKRSLRPENEQHPGVSVYNPAGELLNPKPPLLCETWWVGYPEQNESLTIEENALLNALAEKTAREGFTSMDKIGGDARPCTKYIVKKTDGTELPVTVTGERSGEGRLLRLEIYFPCKGDHRHNQPSKIDMLEQMLGRAQERSALLAELARLRKQLEGRVA